MGPGRALPLLKWMATQESKLKSQSKKPLTKSELLAQHTELRNFLESMVDYAQSLEETVASQNPKFRPFDLKAIHQLIARAGGK